MLAHAHTLALLQSRTSHIRNIAILAHVDHGKTTLSDYLLSSNGLISPKLAGKVRFLDNRADEQERGITMKASSIALLFNDKRAQPTSGPASPSPPPAQPSSPPSSAHVPAASNLYLINLIDSPGHVDFSAEVSNALRVSDGCVVLVDALEGVAVQTAAVLRQAWAERVKPILVINKMDRIISELKMDASDAYRHIAKIIEQVNALTSTFLTEEAMEHAAKHNTGRPDPTAATATHAAAAAPSTAAAAAAAAPAASSLSDPSSSPDAPTAHSVEIDDSRQWTFSPESGNVVFASALDQWAFSLPVFAELLAHKLQPLLPGVKAAALQRALWGDYYLNAKERSVSKKPPKGVTKPMIVQLVLEPLWQVYEQIMVDDQAASASAAMQLASKLGLQVQQREISATKEPRQRLQLLLSRWLPISTCILGSVVDHLPSPVAAQAVRMDKIWPGAVEAMANAKAAESTDQSSSGVGCAGEYPIDGGLVAAVQRCDPHYEHILVYVSKMVDMGAEMVKRITSDEAGVDAVRRGVQAIGAVGTRGAYQRGRFNATGEPVAPTAAGVASVTVTAAEPSADTAAAASTAVEPAPSPPRQDGAAGAGGDADAGIADDSLRFVALARIWCGTMSTDVQQAGQRPRLLHVFGPKFDPLDPSTHAQHRTTIALDEGRYARTVQLFLFMGADVQRIDRVPAGNVLGVSGLGALVANSATLSSCLRTLPFQPLRFQSAPIVRVAVEPLHHSDMRALVRGLKLLNQADANVHIVIVDSGEHVIAASGELHLERCIRDLRERFAPGVQLNVSPPLIAFRETVVIADDKGQPGFAERRAHAERLRKERRRKTKEERRREEEREDDMLDKERKDKEARKNREQQLMHAQATGASAVADATPAAPAFPLAPSSSLDELSSAAGEQPASSIRSASELDYPLSSSAAPAAARAIGAVNSAAAAAAPSQWSRLQHIVEESTSNKCVTLWLQAIPLPDEVTRLLESKHNLLKQVMQQAAAARRRKKEGEGATSEASAATAQPAANELDEASSLSTCAALSTSSAAAALPSLLAHLRTSFSSAAAHSLLSAADVDAIWSFGPRGIGPNMLINRVPDLQHLTALFANHKQPAQRAEAEKVGEEQADEERSSVQSGVAGCGPAAGGSADPDRQSLFLTLSNALLSGFQLACSAGPLCEEPLMGVAFVLERVELSSWDAAARGPDPFGPLSGQVMACMTRACRASMNVANRSPRLMEALYAVDLQCSGDALGALYGVLSRRRGRIVHESVREGSHTFLIRALLPVADSFGFAGELRKKTTGEAQPQLLFSHWALVEQDPFYQPLSQEEVEEFGQAEASALPNLARDMVERVRRRKGLAVQDKVVAHAEKQRTIKR